MSYFDAPRLPPQSIEAEQAVLGGLMLAANALPLVSGLLSESDFYRRDHALIFRAICELDAKRRPFDAVTLGEWFESNGCLDMVQGGAYLIDLATTTPSAANIKAYADIVADKAKLRALIEAGTSMVNNAFQPEGRDTNEIVADAQASVAVLTHSTGHRLKSVNDGLTEMVEDMQRRMDSGGMLGTSYGLPNMDEMTGGKQPGDLIFIAGRPSMGKTTLALQGCMAAGRPLIFSFETMAAKLLARMTANVGRFPLRWILFPNEAPDHAFTRIVEASRIVKEKLSASIYDGRRLNRQQLRAIAIREHSRNPVNEIVVDHFGHMRREGSGRADLEMGEDSKTFKELARELNVPVIVLMQLNRGVEQRPDKRPMLSDLRECGAAEEDADVVAMVYRDGYYNPEGPLAARRDENGNWQAGYAEILLRKNRDGEPGEIWTKAELGEMRFDPTDKPALPTGSVTAFRSTGGRSPGIRAGRQQGEVSRVGRDD